MEEKYCTKDIYEWAAIKLAGGPSPNLETCVVVGQMVVMIYDFKDLPPRDKIVELMPKKEVVALYNKYKHDFAFKEIDKLKEENNGKDARNETPNA
ncbi:hypothetical protein [Neomegalonema sp.]|uniref:hypothetical protein n=1 Tax=Neomegalonema sp. TaxID=2039713 RepID=UPI0026088659|nr:hypothetical protein [Neomegalonema sp.]MDD2869685.1 hypothetical protein [Neomegalonema sp.]